MITRIAIRKIVLLLALIMAAGTIHVSAAGPATPTPEIVFPPPPDPARVKYLDSWYPEKSSFKKKKGFFARLLGGLSGKNKDRQAVTLNRSYGVCTTGETLYVADSEGGAVLVLDRTARQVKRIGGYTPEGRLIRPMGLALDAKGRLFVVDGPADCIKVFSPDGKFLMRFGSKGEGKGQMNRPVDVAYDRKGNRLFIADAGNARVVCFSTEGKYLGHIGSRGTGDGQFSVPVGVGVDPGGRILVTDGILCRVQVFSPEGKFVLKFGEQGDTLGFFARPKGVAADSEGNIYVVDSLFSAVQVFDPQGRLLMHFGSEGDGPGLFQLPAGIHIDAHDRIYVADSLNHLVQEFKRLK